MAADADRQSNDELLARFDARFRGPLMSFFLRRVGNRAEAEDLTQDVFIRLISAAAREQIEVADAFVFQIAANLLRDRGRRSATRAAAQLAEIDDHLVSALTREFLEDRTPERVLLARVEIAEVLKALDELGELTKDIYILFRLEAMKQREIASLHGLTVKSVEKHVMRANLHLAMRFGAGSE
jgi:RNA polymerase sigma factor (sigma-70 family)